MSAAEPATTRPVETLETRLSGQARMGVGRLIAAQVAEVDPDAFEVRQPWPMAEECWGVGTYPLPLPAVIAARRVMLEAQKAERDAIAYARGQGKSWAEIGRALGEEFVTAAKREDMTLTLAAWRYAVYRILPGEEIPDRYAFGRYEAARWQCWTCGKYIYESHPDNGPDAEQGHEPVCARLALRRRRGWR